MNARPLPFRIKRFCLVFIIALIFLPLLPAHADIGPPPVSPGGSSVGPDENVQTNVRMISETVDLTIEPFKRTIPEGLPDLSAYYMHAMVEAAFTMRNLGDIQESMQVWFPLAATTRYPIDLAWEISNHPERIVQDFKVWVDGLPTDTRQVPGPALSLPEEESQWAVFPVVFPPGQDVIVRVNYTIYPAGWMPFGVFEYILQTGAGWKGTIGDATVSIYLPDTVTPENVSLSGEWSYAKELRLEPQPPGYEIKNNTITWHLTDFEPSAEDNIFVEVLEPERYRDLVRARYKAENNPDSADAQLELASAAQKAILIIKKVEPNGGGVALAKEIESAYQRALALAPDQPKVYSEYADWLIASGGRLQLFSGGSCPQALCDLVKQGLEKIPDDPKLKALAQSIEDLLEQPGLFATGQPSQILPTEAPVFPSPTATAVLVPPEATASPLPGPTNPTATAEVTNKITSTEGLVGIIPVAILLVLLGIVIYRRSRS